MIFLCLFAILSCSQKENHQTLSPIRIGDTVEISDFKLIPINRAPELKEKLILFEFWATWCAPCIASFPNLEKIQEKYKGELEILAISDESEKHLSNFLSKNNFNLSFLHDKDAMLHSKFNIKHKPIKFLLSNKGELIWTGRLDDLENVIAEYLKYGKVHHPSLTELNKFYYDREASLTESLSANKYGWSESKSSDAYYVKNQVNDAEWIDIKYSAASITEIISDFLSIEDLNLINYRPELDTILLNIHARSDTITYGKGKLRILKEVQEKYNFNITSITRQETIHYLSISDSNQLVKHITTFDGGGLVERADGQHLVSRLDLHQLASYFQSRLKSHFQYVGTGDKKYNFIFNDFEDLSGLKHQLNGVGLSFTHQRQEVKVIELK